MVTTGLPINQIVPETVSKYFKTLASGVLCIKQVSTERGGLILVKSSSLERGEERTFPFLKLYRLYRCRDDMEVANT